MTRVALVGDDPVLLEAFRSCGAAAEAVEWQHTAGFDRVVVWEQCPKPGFEDWLASRVPVAARIRDPSVFDGLAWRDPEHSHASDEGKVRLVFAGGDRVQATRAIPLREGPPVEQPLGLFQGEHELGREVLVRVCQRFDLLLGRRPPPFLWVTLVRQRGVLVVDDVSMLGPVQLTPEAALAVARAHLPTAS